MAEADSIQIRDLAKLAYAGLMRLSGSRCEMRLPRAAFSFRRRSMANATCQRWVVIDLR